MAPHVIWTEFSPNRKASGVRHATGYPIEVLEYAWDKCGSALISRAVYRYPGFEVKPLPAPAVRRFHDAMAGTAPLPLPDLAGPPGRIGLSVLRPDKFPDLRMV